MSVKKKPSKKNKTKVVPPKKANKQPIALKGVEKDAEKSSKNKASKTISKQNKASNTSEKNVKKLVKKPVVQTSAYLNELEQELERILEKNRQVSIRGSEGFEYCFEENCDQPSTTGGYCRYHYMVSWNYIKKRNKILSEDKLKSWTAELIQNYSTRILDYMVRDLSNEKDFSTALSEMKLVSKKPTGY